MSDHKDLFDLLMDIHQLCAERGLSDDDRLFLFEMAWLTTSLNIENAALIEPGGFVRERQRHVDALRGILTWSSPRNPTWKRSGWFEGGAAELRRHFQERRKASGSG